MTQQDKNYLQHFLEVKFHLEVSQAFEIINSLDSLAALNPFWTLPSEEKGPTSTSETLPLQFHMVSPLFQGKVKLTRGAGWIGYVDDQGNIRIQDKRESSLLRKIIKYSK